MNRLLFIFFIEIFNAPISNAQLLTNQQSFNIGEVGKDYKQIRIPVLNQCRENIYLNTTKSIDPNILAIPQTIASYDTDYITISYVSSRQSKFNQVVRIKERVSSVDVNINGKISTSKNMDCYDFDKKNVRVKKSNVALTGMSQTKMLRIYYPEDKNNLYGSDPSKVPYAHLVILVDASGSMGGSEKLIRIQNYLNTLVEQMRPTDFISILRYSEDADLLLERKSCQFKEEIKTAIDNLEAGGFTNGKIGIENALLYSNESRDNQHSNHIIMFTDGHFNLGEEEEEIEMYMERQSSYLKYRFSIVTIGSNKNNQKEMKSLSKKGNGFYFNLENNGDNIPFLNKLLIKQFSI